MKTYTKLFIPFIYVGVIAFMSLVTLVVVNGIKSYLKENVNYKYTLDGVFEGDVVPVIKTETDSIVRPYIESKVKVSRYFYDYESDNQRQEESLISYENIYMQNTGVDYSCEEEFDVVSVLDGEVIGIEDSELYGKILTIKHSDNLTTVYSNVDNILVTVGYKVSQGEIIGVSAKTDISNNIPMLHFEVIHKGEYMDPENLYTLKVSEIQ